MEISRAKRYSSEGWKYVNTDGSLWPTDHWVPYSKKHPPLSTGMDPSAPRAQIPMDQWNGKEGFYAYVIPVSPSTYKLKTNSQTTLDRYLSKRT